LVADGNAAVNVQMEKLPSTLDDVVVVGYTSVKRKDLLASVSSVGAKDLKMFPLTMLRKYLMGVLPG
jgi:hypothetical protein